ncbi:hypothetical protein [Patulibacter sp. SYSU D01012]|uniref:hypothetical protein n=1 Tax=Patulibacter sp. SYSU D01012 TaxID=2817381 RepID=UPI001B30498A|nr:hypothetical protein [Patulibacter sp. SYSU D01012]
MATLLAAAGLAAPALAADDAGVPDPLAAGPYGVQKVDYDAGTLLLNLPTAGQTTSVPMKGSVTYPTGTKGHPAKVVVFVHGRHAVCFDSPAAAPGPSTGQCTDAEAPDGTPVSTDIRSYAGYDHMAENLASHGYAVMSIEANITGFDNPMQDRGADARSQIINASLRLLDRWNNGRGPVTDDPATTVGLKLVGKLELSSGIGLMGHSRGGDAVTDFVTYNRNNARWPLSGVIALAPTYFSNRRTPEGTNYATLLPACDGDVSPLHGARLYENAKYAPGNDRTAKVQWYVQGTNHNYFNSVWTGDDFRVASDPACSRDAASSARLTPADQRDVGTALMNGFLRRYVGGEKAFDPLMTGEVTLPSSACPAESGKGCGEEVKTSYVAPKADRLDVLRPASLPDPSDATASAGAIDPDATTVAATGGAITAAGLTTFQVCRPATTLYSGGPTTPLLYPVCPQIAAVPASGTSPAVPGVFNRSWGTQFTVAWNAPATLTAQLAPGGGTQDVSRFGVLAMRVATNRGDALNPAGDDVNPAAATQDFEVTLTDADGRRATTTVAKHTTALEPSIGTAYKHVVLNGARVPLTDFAGVDLTRVASVELGFGRQRATGSIQLADVMFQEAAKPLAATEEPPPVPAPTAGPSPQPTLVATPAQAGTVAASTRTACVDAKRPVTRVATLRVGRTGLRVAGRATDAGCVDAAGRRVAGTAGGGVRRTVVSLSRRAGAGCRFLTAKGAWGPPVYCDNPVLLWTRGTGRFALTTKARLAPGRYTATVLTYDRAGNVSRATKRTVRVR